MKILNIKQLLLLLGLFVTCFSSAQTWNFLGPTNMNTANIGMVTAVAMHPTNQNILYAGTVSGGLWKGIRNVSTGNFDWTNITDNINQRGLGISSIVIDPIQNAGNDVIYIATGYFSYYWEDYGAGIYKTTNGGASWTNLVSDTHVSQIRMSPANSSVLVAISDTRIYKTVNAGISWQSYSPAISVGTRFSDIEFKLSDPNKIFASTQGASPNPSQLWLYNIGTNSWGLVSSAGLSDAGFAAMRIDFTGLDPSTIYIMYRDNTPSVNHVIKKSTNDGVTWTTLYARRGEIDAGYYDAWGYSKSEFEISETSINTIYAGSNVLYRSNSPSPAFSEISYYSFPAGPYSTHADIRALQVKHDVSNNRDIVLMGNDGGIAIAFDGIGMNQTGWQNLNGTTLCATQFASVNYFQTNDDIIGGVQDNGTMIKNNGAWAVTGAGGDGNIALVNKDNENIVYTQINSGITGQYILRSTDRGRFNTYTYLPALTENSKNGIAPYPMILDPNNNHNLWYGVKNLHFYNDISNVWTTPWINPDPAHTSDMKCIAIAPGNSQYIYIAFADPQWPGPGLPYGSYPKKLWKSIDGGHTFSDITPYTLANEPFMWSSPSAIVVDPVNPNHIFISFANESTDSHGNPNNRVYECNGSTWTDLTSGLTKFPVYCLVYEEGSNGILFAGTDNGLYMLDYSQPVKHWIPYGTGLPNPIVTHLEINKCRNKIIASTYGRGIWEADLPDLSPLTFAADITYPTGSNTFFDRDVIVNPGVTMTVNGTLNFASGKKLIVKAGARLYVYNGLLTNACGGQWYGVIVEGNNSVDQIPVSNQGYAVFSGATLQNSRYGVEAIGLRANGDYDWTKTGAGIIIAANSFFINNGLCVYIPCYYRPNGLNIVSKFTNCTFELTKTGNITDPQSMKDMIMVCTWGVKGLQFSGCTFRNMNATQNIGDPNTYRGTGIYALNASLLVQDIKASFSQPQQNGYFADLSRGVHLASYSFNPLNICSVNNNTFERNDFGVYMESGTGGSIYRNQFRLEFPASYPALNLFLDKAGIFTLNASGYEISENNFILDRTRFAQHNEVGSAFHNTGMYAGTVVLNSNNGVLVGEQTQNDNSSMTIACNSHQNDKYGIALNPVPLSTALEPITFTPFFGACSTLKKDLNNTFVLNTNTKDLANFTYTTPYPTPGIKNYVIDPALFNRPITQQQFSICPVATQVYPCTPIAPPEPNIWISTTSKIPDYDQLKAVKFGKQGLIDRGGSPGLIGDVQNPSIAPDQLYAELMFYSPYLSNEVMIDMLQYAHQLSENQLVDILKTNAKLEQPVMDALVFRDFSPNSLEIINNAQLTNDPSLRALLTDDIMDENIQLSALRNNILNYFAIGDMIDSTHDYGDSTIIFLTNENDLISNKQLIPIYIERGMTGQASELLQSISQAQSDDETQNYVLLMTVLNDLRRSNGNVFTMTLDQQQEVRQVATSETQISSAAKNILGLVFQEYYDVRPVPLPQDIQVAARQSAPVDSSAYVNNLLKVFPNPAATSLNVDFTIAKKFSKASLHVFDASGSLVSEIPVNQMNGQMIINTSKMENGIYFIELIADDDIVSVKKFVIFN